MPAELATTANIAWSAWTRLPLKHGFAPASLSETLDGGQAFRWQTADRGVTWQGVFGEHAVQLRLAANHNLEFRAATDPTRAEAALLPYLGMAAELDTQLARLPVYSDAVLATAIAACPGLILLRQPFGETLLSFILSSTKQIPQIRQLCERLATRFGKPLVPGIHALPTWEQLAAVTEADLRACGLGFRARYVHQTAQMIAGRPSLLVELECAPYPEAKSRLCEFPGVGEKVADCVLLFGAGRLEAFPVDVWILRALAGRYGLEGWTPAHVAHFGRVHFGPNAGLAQQYLFTQERSGRH